MKNSLLCCLVNLRKKNSTIVNNWRVSAVTKYTQACNTVRVLILYTLIVKRNDDVRVLTTWIVSEKINLVMRYMLIGYLLQSKFLHPCPLTYEGSNFARIEIF